ncbi:MAG TPA: flagellar hook-length control protein FliK [Pseudogracilibacillus sp.]|nr:flagellar hook-length control protein FliK [Pseudogracilibacillus sp.]
MNVIDVFVKNTETVPVNPTNSKSSQNKDAVSFQALLSSHQTVDQGGNVDSETAETTESPIEIFDETDNQHGEHLTTKELDEVNGEYQHTIQNDDMILKNNEHEEIRNKDLKMNDEFMRLINQLEQEEKNYEDVVLTNSFDEFLDESQLDSDGVTLTEEISVEHIIKQIDSFEDSSLYQQAAQLLSDFSKIIQQTTNPEQLKHSTSRLLGILEQWTSMKSQVNETDIRRLTTNKLTESEVSIFKDIINAYTKRNHFSKQQMYGVNATVTKTDVYHWVQQALNEYSIKSEQVPINPSSSFFTPISEIQQYVIHVERLEGVDKVMNEVIHKFQQIIRDSKFLHTPNLGQQLTVRLQPENLGNMTVRFMQMDGEMAVKIFVTSHAAREMLESNIHQLKHMFLPHQVVIERDAFVSDEKFFGKDSNQEKQDEESSHESEESEEQEDEKQEVDFQGVFQQLREEGVIDE